MAIVDVNGNPLGSEPRKPLEDIDEVTTHEYINNPIPIDREGNVVTNNSRPWAYVWHLQDGTVVTEVYSPLWNNIPNTKVTHENL